MSMSNVSQTRGNIEKPFIRALFRMPKTRPFRFATLSTTQTSDDLFFRVDRYATTCIRVVPIYCSSFISLSRLALR